jgi:hypothetical protein
MLLPCLSLTFYVKAGKVRPLMVFIKFYWNIVTLIHIIAYGYFQACTVELSSCDKYYMTYIA